MGNIPVGLPDVKGKNVYGGFKHNVQSMRMLNCLEEKYADHAGLDVSYQVLEGVLKHTKYRQKQCSSCTLEKCDRGCCDLKLFLGEGNVERLFTGFPFPTTLEGQVVAVADEIAQRSHDVDDAMSAHLLDYAGLCRYLEQYQMKPLQNIIERSYRSIKEGTRIYVSESQMLCSRVISDIINYLVNDVVAEARHRIMQFGRDDFYETEHRFSKKLIDFSEEGTRICSLLEDMVTGKVIISSEVAKFDHNASKVVKALFGTYYSNPRLLHANTLKRAVISMRSQVSYVVDLLDESPGKVQKEINAITARSVYCDLPATQEQRENWIKHTILVRAITDYIAGMTDSFALNEYRSFI